MQYSVLSYLDETTKKYPDKVAVEDKEKRITFLELKSKALGICREIQKRSIQKHMPILVYLPKGVECICSFMGIVYSGNFYTPTDVNFPFQKTESIIDVLGPMLYVANTKTSEKLKQNNIPDELIINYDKIEDVYDFESVTVAEVIDTDIVYTLFTSGSTGVPKGVSITHRSIIDYIDWAVECFQVDDKRIIGNQAPFYFDNSTLDVYLSLSTGATLEIIPETFFAFPARLMDYVKDKNINMVFWVPSVLINVANTDILSKMDCSCLKYILFAGEVMPNKHLNYWRKHIPHAVYANLYGPTEITVDCTYYIVDREFDDDEPLPIGIPCKNSDVLILNDKDELIQKQDEIGELCVRGSSLAVGYWNNLEKTEEVFVQNPLNKNYREYIYRTGDLVYLNEKNEIMFAGRKDFQIKHMGYRIELGEIETAALAIQELKNVCVIYDLSQKRLVMCYEADGELEANMIRKKMIAIIPKYMVPTDFKYYSKLPLTANGKIDRKSLEKEFQMEDSSSVG